MPVIHRKTLAVWPFLANTENLTQRLSYMYMQKIKDVMPYFGWCPTHNQLLTLLLQGHRECNREAMKIRD